MKSGLDAKPLFLQVVMLRVTFDILVIIFLGIKTKLLLNLRKFFTLAQISKNGAKSFPRTFSL